MKEMTSHGIGELILSKFDSLSSIIARREGEKTVPIDRAMVEKLNMCFKRVIPWNKYILQVVKRRIEIVGIPLHLWTDENIMKIGQCLGEGEEIHFTK